MSIKKIISILSGNNNEYTQDLIGQVNAINKVLAVIEFKPNGTIMRVNGNFSKVVGYTEAELIGKHHQIFVDQVFAQSSDYKSFWDSLSSGQFIQGQFNRVGKEGKDVWLEASYNPIFDKDNNVIKVVKYATDVTQNKIKEANFSGQIEAINKIQAVIEFDLNGYILDANDNFCQTVGYSKQELTGQHHSMFVEPEYKSSSEYKAFWAKLNRGEADHGQYKRIGKNGKTIWLEANYNPIFDLKGNVAKIVKFATNITESRLEKSNFQGQILAINQVQAVIEFDLNGNILQANDNFTKTMDYAEKELIGKHHSMFMDPKEASSEAYRNFWKSLASGISDRGEFKRFAKGNKEVWLQGIYSVINDDEGKPYKVVKFASDITSQMRAREAEIKSQNEAARILSMIESASTNMMMADNDGFITYMNPATQALMNESASTFRKVLPNFDPSKIVGSNFDIFHKTPSHQRNMLGNLTKPYDTTIPVANMFFKLKASPIFLSDGSRQGTSLEWVNVTAEKSAELEISKIVEAASNGDLTSRLNVSDKVGAVETICNGINSLLDKMAEVIVQVRDASQTINTAANEIATGNNDLSQRTEQQASSLEETAASMEELASTVKNNAENAKQANQLAGAASTVAIRGGDVVGQVVGTMAEINASAKKIEDIISVIDGIAFQTNILALNAAVEAARAGEQGRGFAVVAGEVRNLAQRSASAAKEIKELISDSVTKTAEGTAQVEQAGKTMQDIVSSVQRVTDIMGEITAASTEQSAGIDQINTAITSMDEVTQQNSALVEEAAAAAESLVEQAASLVEVVSEFKLNNSSFNESSKNKSNNRQFKISAVR